MSVREELLSRSGSSCELCTATNELQVYEVPPVEDATADTCIIVCSKCKEQLEEADKMEPNHWRCLNDSMWSQVPAVQVVVWRMLNRLRNEGWPQDLLDMLYLDEETQKWAEKTSGVESDEESVKHLDSNGAELQSGDTVTLIKDLNVKGGGFTAKRGTAVRGISLVADNPEQIEGKVSGQQIVILTKFVKKAN